MSGSPSKSPVGKRLGKESARRFGCVITDVLQLTSPMDSINENQSEENRQDLTGIDAIDKIRELVKKAETCFFCTATPVEGSSGSRPMAPRQVDDDGNLWFLSADDSHKNLELETNPAVRLYFQGSPHSEFLMLCGKATVSKDKAKIKELWEPVIRTWFTGGVDDPRITVIKVTPSEGYYWDTKHGYAVAGIKMLIGAAIGKTMDDSVEGTLKV
jgi:general stress protein 26